jgi:hypothetical protein
MRTSVKCESILHGTPERKDFQLRLTMQNINDTLIRNNNFLMHHALNLIYNLTVAFFKCKMIL